MAHNRRDVNWNISFGVLTMLTLTCTSAAHADGAVAAGWGNSIYVDLAVGDSVTFLGRQVRLVSTQASHCTVRVDSVSKELIVARRSLPDVINGVRVFVAMNRSVAQITPDSIAGEYGLMQKDVLLCLSNPARPLLEPERYAFPISRRDGYHWSMEEGSHMFAYLGWAAYMSKYRSHEGIDLNMHDARGKQIHPLVAIETGTVVLAAGPEVTGAKNEGCIIIRSKSQQDIYYVYKHVHEKSMRVKNGQRVIKGQIVGYIWGDGKWGHLHFAAVRREEQPGYRDRYDNLLNCFPQLYELWHGDLHSRQRHRTEGEFRFDKPYWLEGYSSPAYAYDAIVGYGWRLGRWCAAGRIEGDNEPNGRLRKVLHQGTPAETINPSDYYDFEVEVQPGRYSVRLNVGDQEHATWQRVSVEGVNIGTYSLTKNELQWTPETVIPIRDGRLTVRLHIKDDNSRYAAVQRIQFQRILK